MRDPETLWQDYAAHTIVDAGLGFALDTSRMDLTEAALLALAPGLARAQEEMVQLEAGAIANPDEKRMVGHYWLRDSARAPTAALRSEIDAALAAVQRFATDVHAGRVTGPTGKPFSQLLVIGIGGSALGPQLAADALGGSADKLAPFFFDNTDPDGFDRVLHALAQRDGLARTLCVVISKSGGTAETRNGMLEAQAAYRAQGLDPARAMVAVTGAGSALDVAATQQGFLARFPMWDWVGGRTSELSAVGLLPAALQGIDITAMLDGARAMDALTRTAGVANNPALRLAAAWHVATDGRGHKDMVVLPYKDRLVLFSKYLQQLVMESLGKALDLDGNVVHQGLAVYGNKGSTDQHAYVQQLRDGIANFFVTFIAVKQSRSGPSLDVEPGVTAGDFLNGFWLGTRRALYEGGRQSITVSIDALTPRTLGALIALYERAVGFYASLVRVNAYHQPGVEAGKKAAQAVIALQAKVLEALRGASKEVGTEGATVAQLAAAAGASTDVETVFHVLEHLHHNGRARKIAATRWHDARYSSGQ